MPLKFRLELEVVLDEDAQAAVIESARRLCMRAATIDPQGVPEGALAEEVIADPEDALMELVERNPLLAEVLAQVERISCGPAEALQPVSTPEGARDGS